MYVQLTASRTGSQCGLFYVYLYIQTVCLFVYISLENIYNFIKLKYSKFYI